MIGDVAADVGQRHQHKSQEDILDFLVTCYNMAIPGANPELPELPVLSDVVSHRLDYFQLLHQLTLCQTIWIVKLNLTRFLKGQ